MFRNWTDDGHLSGGRSSSSPPVHGVASGGLSAQESSWIGMLSVVSRPALTFLQKYLPVRNPFRSEPGPGGWTSGDLKSSLADAEGEFLRQLDDMMPLAQHAAPHLTYLRCPHGAAAGLLQSGAGAAPPWLTADSLRELGIDGPEDVDFDLRTQGHVSSARTVVSQVLLGPAGGPDWVRSGAGRSWTWWGNLWGGEGGQGGAGTGALCPQQETKGSWMLGERPGLSLHKDQDADSGGPPLVQNAEGSTSDRQTGISGCLNRSGAALTPDQDNGYSSLEEEHVQMCQLLMVMAPSQEPPLGTPPLPPPLLPPPPGPEAAADTQEEEAEEGGASSGKEEEEKCGDAAAESPSPVASPVASPAPQCQNKAIAFIMGCPCSDDSSASEAESDDDDDDDGFDSEGSSDLSDSSDDDEEDDEDGGASSSDGELDPEAERLWSSLSRGLDPYDPRNFTAALHTAATPPQSVPAATPPPSSTHSTPVSSPSDRPLSSPPPADVWDDSTSASEADEAESLRLWSSFSSASDPYSPFNFQAPLRTRGPPGAKTGPAHTGSTHRAAAPQYRKEEAEERLDSGFSEAPPPSSSSSSQSCGAVKKVRFRDDVEFIPVSGDDEEDEDRRGPWEELARDRCRFLRRCQEVEQNIAYCLQPQHRRRVMTRLHLLHQ